MKGEPQETSRSYKADFESEWPENLRLLSSGIMGLISGIFLLVLLGALQGSLQKTPLGALIVAFGFIGTVGFFWAACTCYEGGERGLITGAWMNAIGGIAFIIFSIIALEGAQQSMDLPMGLFGIVFGVLLFLFSYYNVKALRRGKLSYPKD